jgi:tetratricopeptide (TPR) repeat protein
VFYIAMLPASRIIGFGEVGPHINERYLYFPSLGLVIALAFGCRALGKRFGSKILLLPGLLVLMALSAITWDRNADWASEILLFETEYNQGDQGHNTLGQLTAAHLAEGNIARVIRICDRHPDKQQRYGSYNFHCGLAYREAKLLEDAERVFLRATESRINGSDAHSNLGQIYVWQQRREEAIRHFELAVETQEDPAIRAFNKGDMLIVLYPRDRAKLLEAREHFKEALRLQPQWGAVRQQLNQLEMMLGIAE